MNKPETTPPTYFHHLRDGTFARICRALATTPDEILGFGSHGKAGAEAEPDRRRALAAVEAMDGRALKIAAVVLESIATRQDEF